MCSAALNAVQAGNGRNWIFNNQFPRFVSNEKRITVLVHHIDQVGQFNTVNVYDDPAHVEGQYVDGIGFHRQGQLHGCTSRYLPVVMSVTAL